MLRRLPLLVLLAAIAIRGWLHFSTPLVQGMNGGYYLVQARSLLEKFSLAIPDLPLVFTLQACLAKLIQWCSSLDLNQSVMLAVKTVDSVLPSLSVIPVMLLGSAWSRRKDKVDLGIIGLAALLVPAGAPALLMVGDFEKNSLGLALLCGLAWAIHRWTEEHSRKRLLVAVGLLGLIGITHIGVFGTTLIFVGSCLGALAVAHGKEGLLKVARLALIAAPVIGLAAGLVFWKFDPSRVQKLIHAFSEPSDYLGSGGFPGGGNGPGGRGGPGMMGMGPPGMGGSGWMQYAPMLAYALAVIPALILVWLKRRTIGVQNLVVISGAAITVIMLTGPWVHGDKTMRFQLNAVPLAVICLMFTLLQIPHRWARGLPGILLLLAALVPTGLKLQAGPRPIISVEAQQELKALVPDVLDPEHTLIVARHGLEWWTAWTLHTHIAQAQALTAADWKKYKNVWFIESKKGMNGPMMGGMIPGFGGPPGMGGGPGDRRPGRERGGEIPSGMRMPPGANGGRGGPMGMQGAPIPSDAEVWHDGEYFKLAWVQQPPEFVLQREANPLDPFTSWP